MLPSGVLELRVPDAVQEFVKVPVLQRTVTPWPAKTGVHALEAPCCARDTGASAATREPLQLFERLFHRPRSTNGSDSRAQVRDSDIDKPAMPPADLNRVTGRLGAACGRAKPLSRCPCACKACAGRKRDRPRRIARADRPRRSRWR